MEETINYQVDNSSANGNQMETETVLNKKRKLPAEQLGLPLSKHKSLESSYLESRSIANVHPEERSTSLIGGTATTMSISGKLRNDIWYSKATSSGQPSTSSINSASTCSTNSLYSMESRSVSKASSSSGETEAYHIGSKRDGYHNHFGSHSSPYYDDEHDLEFISHADYACSELRDDNMEQCTKDEDQDVIYANGVISSNYVLPSGRDKEQGGKKLTIDKEFEEYFSELML